MTVMMTPLAFRAALRWPVFALDTAPFSFSVCCAFELAAWGGMQVVVVVVSPARASALLAEAMVAAAAAPLSCFESAPFVYLFAEKRLPSWERARSTDRPCAFHSTTAPPSTL
jgi:hypothetical protein